MFKLRQELKKIPLIFMSMGSFDLVWKTISSFAANSCDWSLKQTVCLGKKTIFYGHENRL